MLRRNTGNEYSVKGAAIINNNVTDRKLVQLILCISFKYEILLLRLNNHFTYEGNGATTMLQTIEAKPAKMTCTVSVQCESRKIPLNFSDISPQTFGNF